jgi:hypothetical protein
MNKIVSYIYIILLAIYISFNIYYIYKQYDNLHNTTDWDKVPKDVISIFFGIFI